MLQRYNHKTTTVFKTIDYLCSLNKEEHSVSHYSFSKDYGEVIGVHEQERGQGKGEVMNERCGLNFLIRHKDFRKYISRSALEKDPRPGPLFEGNPGGEGTTRRGTATPVHRPQRPAGSTHSSTRGLRPPEQLERPAGFPSSDKTHNVKYR